MRGRTEEEEGAPPPDERGPSGSPPRRLAARARSLGEAFVAAGVLGAGAATLAGFLGRAWWAFDLAAHFRVQYAVVLAMACGALLVSALSRGGRGSRGTRIWAGVAGGFALINLAVVAPLYLGGAGRTPGGGADAPTLRAVLLNLDLEHPEPGRVAAYLAEADPDVVVLLELSARWDSALTGVLADHPHRITALRESPFGIGLFSRVPLVAPRVVTPGEGMPTLVAGLRLGGAELTLVGTHPFPPLRAGGTALRNRQLEAVGELAGAVEGPVLVLGDLNTTPWSWIWSRLVERGGLADPDRGLGIAATWPAGAPALLRLPLDQALPSPELRVIRREVGPDVGSDHRPLELEVAPHRASPARSPEGNR